MAERWRDATPLRKGQAWTQRDGDDTAVYDPETGSLHLLNPSALALWELCDGETTPQEMAQAVADLTTLDEAAAWDDVVAGLDRLADLGLVEAEVSNGRAR